MAPEKMILLVPTIPSPPRLAHPQFA